MKLLRMIFGIAVILFIPGYENAVLAQQSSQPLPNSIIFTPPDITWNASMKAFPKGANIFILEGDPGQPGPFTFRIKFPAGYKLPPHYYPVMNKMTVLTGSINLGWGDKLDTSKPKVLPAGSFAIFEPNVRHFFWTEMETIIQFEGIGPFSVVYVSPETDWGTK